MIRPNNHRYARWTAFAIWAIALLIVAPHFLSDFNLNLLGRFLAYAIVALGLDLIWGYAGMLSLGQGLFFGLGAYCCAMYVTLEQAGNKLPEFMGLYGVTELPGFWQPFHSPIFALALAVVLPMGIAAVLGFMVFRSRVRGVYFSIITQALTAIVSLLLIGQQQLINGTNGLTISDSGTLFGFPLENSSTKQGIYLVTVICLGAAYLLCRRICDSRFGRLLVAIRDDENRVRFAGYNPVTIKVIVFALSAGLAGLGGALFFPQGGIISPAALGIVPSIEMVIWVAVGGRGTLVGAVIGAIVVNAGKSWISTQSPDAWQLIVGALFVGIVLFFPDGIVAIYRTQLPALWLKLTGKPVKRAIGGGSIESAIEIDSPQAVEAS
ncbi:MAG: urea ABC transporter permease subunit UrtC [Aggregatilineales bacterium]